MSTEVSDLRDPDCIRLSHIELALQMVRCHHGCRTAAFEATLAILCLRVQASGTHDAVDTIDPALLAEIAQVISDFPVAVHRTASQPGLLDGPEQAPVFQGPSAVSLGPPGIKSAGVHCHHLAQPSNRMVSASITNEGVPSPDILAEYAVAFFKMSRSAVTRLSSAFRRFIST
jgi:hypothetical protein